MCMETGICVRREPVIGCSLDRREHLRSNMRRASAILAPILCALTVAGCASSKGTDAPQQSRVESAVLEASYETTWRLVKDSLLEEGYEIRTRDKRGMYVAFSGTKRRFIIPHRYRLTVILDSLSGSATRVTIETVRQSYRLTPLTHPGWQDSARPKEEDLIGPLMDRIRSKADSPSRG